MATKLFTLLNMNKIKTKVKLFLDHKLRTSRPIKVRLFFMFLNYVKDIIQMTILIMCN